MKHTTQEERHANDVRLAVARSFVSGKARALVGEVTSASYDIGDARYEDEGTNFDTLTAMSTGAQVALLEYIAELEAK